MGHAILYCSGCSERLREPDFEKGLAFRVEGRAFCRACAPEEVRSPLEQKPAPLLESNSRIPKVASTARIATVEPPETFPKALVFGGAAVLLGGLILFAASSGGNRARPQADRPAAVAIPAPDPTPAPAPTPPPAHRNNRDAEEALRKAREFAQAHPDNLSGQFVLFDAAVRVSEETGHFATAVRERDAVRARQKAVVQAQLEPLDAAVKAACAREDFGAALKLLEEARAKPLGDDWTPEIVARAQTVDEAADKLFAAVRNAAVDARRRGAEDVVARQIQRVDRWGMEKFRTELARAVVTAPKPAPKPTPPAPPKEVDTYRRRWSEAMALAAGRDYAAAIKKIEEAKPGLTDPAVQTEVALDLELLRLAMAAHDEAAQALAKTPKGQKLALFYLNEGGALSEASGTVARLENHEIDLSREKGSVQIPLGEVAAKSLAQIAKSRREGKGPAVLCLLEGDAEAARGLVEGAAAIPEKYWTHRPAVAAAEATARRLFYAGERDLASHLRAAEGVQKFAALLKDHAQTAFVRRNRVLVAARAEGGREFFFVSEDFRAAGTFKAVKGEKDEFVWKTSADGDPARLHENYVELAFSALAEAEYRCWVYVGGCCTEAVTLSHQVTEATEPGGDQATPLKQTLSMQYRTHAAHAGRGRPTPRWGWIQIPLPRFATPGVKKVRIVTAAQGLHVAQALVSATRNAPPPAGEAAAMERARTDARGPARFDPTLVGWWKFAEGAGAVAADSSPTGIEGKLMNGAAWAPGTSASWGPPSVKLAGNAYVDIGTGLPLLQGVSGYTIAAWINADKIAGTNDQNKILSLSKHNGTTLTGESRASIMLVNGGCLSAGGRSADSDKLQSVRTTDKVIKPGTWYHVAGVVDLAANTIAIYVNGAAQPTTGTVAFSAKSTPETRITCAAIGSEENEAKWTFQGRISSLRVYGRTLSKEEIAELAVPAAALR